MTQDLLHLIIGTTVTPTILTLLETNADTYYLEDLGPHQTVQSIMNPNISVKTLATSVEHNTFDDMVLKTVGELFPNLTSLALSTHRFDYDSYYNTVCRPFPFSLTSLRHVSLQKLIITSESFISLHRVARLSSLHISWCTLEFDDSERASSYGNALRCTKLEVLVVKNTSCKREEHKKNPADVIADVIDYVPLKLASLEFGKFDDPEDVDLRSLIIACRASPTLEAWRVNNHNHKFCKCELAKGPFTNSVTCDTAARRKLLPKF